MKPGIRGEAPIGKLGIRTIRKMSLKKRKDNTSSRMKLKVKAKKKVIFKAIKDIAFMYENNEGKV